MTRDSNHTLPNRSDAMQHHSGKQRSNRSTESLINCVIRVPCTNCVAFSIECRIPVPKRKRANTTRAKDEER
jgi:hypothetical protein